MNALTAEALAVITAVLWASGSYFEKQGLRDGGLSPATGIFLRTAAALVVLAAVASPFLREIPRAGGRSLLFILLGGGLLAGALGMLCYYAALSKGELSRVMTIAFTFTPCAGALIAAVALNEMLSPLKLAGISLCCAGVVMLMWK
jgi:transporter family protein